MADLHILKVAGEYDHIRQICDFMLAGAVEAGLAEENLFKIELACDEACTNIIEHAYGGEGVGDITATWQAETNTFTMTLHDNGRSFSPDDIAQPSSVTEETDPDDLKIGGLGLYFMRSLMSEVYYQFDETNGNTLTMVKYIVPTP